VTDQKGLSSTEEQVKDLSNSVSTFDSVIKNIDSILDIYQQQRTLLVEQRAKLVALRDILMSPASKVTKGALGDLAFGIAATTLEAATGNYVGAALQAAHTINSAINSAQEAVDAHTANIEHTLHEQNEWLHEHQGRESE